MGRYTLMFAARPCAVALIALAIAARVAHGADPDAAQGMRTANGLHYVIHTDIEDATLVDDLTRRMDVMFDQYGLALQDFHPSDGMGSLPVYLFAQRKRYMAFTDYAGTNSGGMFVGGRHPYLASFVDDNGRDGIRRSLQHEAFHQFAFYAISRRMPIWLNEGMAQLFEEGIWTNRKFLLGQVPPRRVRQLKGDMLAKRLLPLADLFAISSNDWARALHEDVAAGARNYNQAWAVAHFLRYGSDRQLQQQLADYLTKLHADPTADPQAVFAQCFPDIPALQRAFDRWIGTVRGTPEATLLERQEILGDFLVGLAPKAPGVVRSIALLRQLVLRMGISLTYTRNGQKYSTVRPPDLYFADLNGLLYGERQLHYEPSRDAPLPDIVCKPNDAFTLRTRFYQGAAHIEHETAILPAER